MAYDSMKKDGAVLYFREMSDEDLEYWAARNEADLQDPSKAQYHQHAKGRLEGIRSEQAARRNGTQRAAPTQQAAAGDPPKQAQPAAPRTNVVGLSVITGGNLMAKMQELSDKVIPVTPITVVEELPEGVGVSLSPVRADIRADCYRITGGREDPQKPDDELALNGDFLQMIAGAVGLSWKPELTERTDDRSNPYRVEYRVWCCVYDIDGKERLYPGECEVDLSDGGPQAIDIIETAKRKGDRNPEKQLAQARKFIQRSTLTKAMDAAIRKACGLRHKYRREELETKPFLAAKVYFTGRTSDPMLKPLFAQIVAQRFGEAKTKLFGPAKAEQPVITTNGEVVDDDLRY